MRNTNTKYRNKLDAETYHNANVATCFACTNVTANCKKRGGGTVTCFSPSSSIFPYQWGFRELFQSKKGFGRRKSLKCTVLEGGVRAAWESVFVTGISTETAIC
jgi:hypothetical protein